MELKFQILLFIKPVHPFYLKSYQRGGVQTKCKFYKILIFSLFYNRFLTKILHLQQKLNYWLISTIFFTFLQKKSFIHRKYWKSMSTKTHEIYKYIFYKNTVFELRLNVLIKSKNEAQIGFLNTEITGNMEAIKAIPPWPPELLKCTSEHAQNWWHIN